LNELLEYKIINPLELSGNVRVPNFQATMVLSCSNEPVLKADSESVRISEISQQMPEIPTFFCQFGLNLWKFEKNKKNRTFMSGFERRGGKKQISKGN